MNILAIDTTTKKAIVGIKINNKNYINWVDNEITHSEKLLPLIDKTLKENNVSINDIDILACTTGPGSFTGIRIGIATIKALSKVTGAKIFCIDNLSALAYSTLEAPKYKMIVPLLDARNKRAYAGMYLNENNYLKQIERSENKYVADILDDIRNVCNTYNINSNDVLIISDNDALLSEFNLEYNKMVSSLDLNVLLNKAEKSNNYTDYLHLDAMYVRSSEAERTKYGE